MDCAVYMRNVTLDGINLVMLIPANDEYVGADIASTGHPFAAGVLSKMLEHVHPGAVVVDAGCNFGSYAMFFAVKVQPSGVIHCFEPQRKMAQLASANAVINGLSRNVIVHNYALSFENATVQMGGR